MNGNLFFSLVVEFLPEYVFKGVCGPVEVAFSWGVDVGIDAISDAPQPEGGFPAEDVACQKAIGMMVLVIPVASLEFQCCMGFQVFQGFLTILAFLSMGWVWALSGIAHGGQLPSWVESIADARAKKTNIES